MPLRVAIAGCGMIAGGPVRDGRPILGTHAAACRELGLPLVAAADPDGARRAAFGAHWGVTDLYADTAEMLRAARPDLVVVATPAETHERICLDALAAGARGILCEKPFTGHADSARRVCEAARAANVPLVVNFNRRWDASHQALLERLAGGEIGAVRTLHGCYTGTLRGNGSHLVDTVRLLAGNRWTIEWTSALGRDESDGPLSLVLASPDGARAFLAPVEPASYFVFELEVLCSDGRARLASNGNDIRLSHPVASRDFPGYRYLEPTETLPAGTLPGSFARALAALASSVTTGQPLANPPDAFLGTLELIDQAVHAARTKGSPS